MRLLRDPYFISVGLNHMATDVFNGQNAVLLVFLAPALGMTNADIGMVMLMYTACGALTQPLFGLLADRTGAYWLSGVGLVWMAGWFGAAVLAPGWWALPALITSALGSAALHSSGTERATARGKTIMAGRAVTAASLFFLFGQAGLSFGPVIGGLLLQMMGARGILVLAAVAMPVALNSLYWMHWRAARTRQHVIAGEDEPTLTVAGQNVLRRGRGVMAAFALLIVLRTAPQVTTMTFLPKLFHDRGFSPAEFGAIVSVFMAGAAIGGLGGGVLADRWGHRRTIMWTLMASVAPMYIYPVALGLEVYPLVFLSGAFNGASHSVIVVLAQALIPRSRALASGLTLGFMFASGSVAAYLFGLAADVFPLASVLQINGALSLCAALLTLAIWHRSTTP